MRCSMLNLYLDEGYGLKNMGPRLSLSKAYTIPLQINLTALVWPQCQSNSWELLYDKSQQELKKQSETKLDGSLKYYGAN